MIPPILARELRETILDYLETTFALSDEETANALRKFLEDPEEGIFKGPYVDVRLPFRVASGDVEIPLEVKPPFTPYAHQLQAFDRLSTLDGRAPGHTLVTTGTGSGKTECFLYPIMDHCLREVGQPGIKAVILYPMNALAADQARRLAKLIWDDDRLKNRVTAGMYVGQEKGTKSGQQAMTRDGLITDRKTMREHPPDILLTNYRMLDFLLLRYEDQPLWKRNAPDTLRYLVLDELHTYDGAQGGDVACLIRRLKAKVGSPEGLPCSVGTSATLGSREGDAAVRLCDFASQLFGQTFDPDSLVLEQRKTPDEFFPEETTRDELPSDVKLLLPKEREDGKTYLGRLIGVWLGKPIPDLAYELARHQMTRDLLSSMEGAPVEWRLLKGRIAGINPEFAEFSCDHQDLVLCSFMDMLSQAKVGETQTPFVTTQVQIWVREVRRLMREVLPEPGFFWRDDRSPRVPPRGLPATYCRECGHSGWMGVLLKNDDHVRDRSAEIYDKYFKRSRDIVYIFPSGVTDEDDIEEGLFVQYLCPHCLMLSEGAAAGNGDSNHKKSCSCEVDPFPVVAYRKTSSGTPEKDLQRCPACSTDFSMRVGGSQAASLSSVAVSHLFLSPLNADKKLLAFTDSVQDASHRAAFFAGRTYRIGLRTAIQAAVDENEGITLADLGSKIGECMTSRDWSGVSEREMWARIVATLMPPDLNDLPEYRTFMKKPTADNREKVLWRLNQRMLWEVIMEYGYNARVGRTLEKSGASCAAVDRKILAPVLDRLMDTLPQEFGTLEGLERERLRHFISGLLERTRVRGGVDHNFLHKYARDHGKWFLLTKQRTPLMSPYGSMSRRFRMLTDRMDHETFDSYVSPAGTRTWYVDWAARSLGIPEDVGVINDVYRAIVKALEEGQVLRDMGPAPSTKKRKGTAYAIVPSAIRVTRNVSVLRCEVCGKLLSVPTAQEPDWNGETCLGFRCEGVYRPDNRDTGHFYRRIYRSASVERVFTAEHTGLLPRSKRERVENLFQTGSEADAPNLLACTPTLEMGIDVGDLSATMACSIPPTTANYLQRIGRAGRSTGNATVLALANARPHDLYFFEDPLEMMAGEVTPPGCFLDAPEVLKRQLLAFVWDCWAAEDSRANTTPKDLQMMLAQHERGEYTAALEDFAVSMNDQLLDRFSRIFAGDITAENMHKLVNYASSGGMMKDLREAVEAAREEIKNLRNQRERLRKRLARLEENPGAVDNFDDVKAEHEEEIQLVNNMLGALQKKYPLQLMSDSGLLPNYAFPESGVTLKATVRGVKTQNRAEPYDKQHKVKGDYETHEWMRPASSAISELAPMNTFYAESRKLKIDQVDVGGRKRSKVESWVFCESCHHMIMKLDLAEGIKTCPACGAPGFDDTGRRHEMVRMTRVSSRTDHLSSRVNDETDDREKQRYQLLNSFEVQEKNWGGGWLLRELGFGFEYLKNVTLRQMNMGPDEAFFGQTMEIAGRKFCEHGFKLCADCGVVDDPRDQRTPVRHRFHCEFNTAGKQAKWLEVFLYREMESEAIRMILPVSNYRYSEVVSTFKACLALGLKQRFQGQPIHLALEPQSEPTPEGAARRFLLAFDTVPGGTGYLKELASTEGFMKVLELALEALKSCSCNKRENRDGCYRCLFAYQDQYERDYVSRDLGVDLLTRMLEKKDALEEIRTLSDVPVDHLEESELEMRFSSALNNAFDKKREKVDGWTKEPKEEKICYRLSVNGNEYLVEPQVYLGPSEGVMVSSKPDFLITPVEQNRDRPTAKPVAVFTDGFAYHVKPREENAGIRDDMQKRAAIWESGNYRVWSLTWWDVEDFDTIVAEPVPMILSGDQRADLNKLRKGADIRLPENLPETNGIKQLLAYLANPDDSQWTKFAAAYCLALASSNKQKVDLSDSREILARMKTQVGLPDRTPPDGTAIDAAFYNHISRRDFTFATTLSLEAAKTMDADNIHALLRLEDTPQARRRDDYRETWRRFLLMCNVMQFLPTFEVVTTEGVRG